MDKKNQLEKIAKEIENCRVCQKDKIGKAVPGEGNPDASIVFLGEAPGREEAKTGRPFVGRSGKFLRAIIKDIGIDEKEVYITSPVKYLPKRGTPSPKEIEHGKKHLIEQIKVINPKIIVVMGRVGVRAILGRDILMNQNHGQFIKENGILFFITFHPAAGIRFVRIKKLFIEDFKKLKNAVQNTCK